MSMSNEFKDGEIVILGTTKFRIEVVSEDPFFIKAHPVDDPLWLLRYTTEEPKNESTSTVS